MATVLLAWQYRAGGGHLKELRPISGGCDLLNSFLSKHRAELVLEGLDYWVGSTPRKKIFWRETTLCLNAENTWLWQWPGWKMANGKDCHFVSSFSSLIFILLGSSSLLVEVNLFEYLLIRPYWWLLLLVLVAPSVRWHSTQSTASSFSLTNSHGGHHHHPSHELCCLSTTTTPTAPIIHLHSSVIKHASHGAIPFRLIFVMWKRKWSAFETKRLC